MTPPNFVTLHRAFDGVAFRMNATLVAMLEPVRADSLELPEGCKAEDFTRVYFSGGGGGFVEVRGAMHVVEETLLWQA